MGSNGNAIVMPRSMTGQVPDEINAQFRQCYNLNTKTSSAHLLLGLTPSTFVEVHRLHNIVERDKKRKTPAIACKS